MDKTRMLYDFIISVIVLVFSFAFVAGALLMNLQNAAAYIAGAWGLAGMVVGAWIKGGVPGIGTPVGPPTTAAPPIAPPAP